MSCAHCNDRQHARRILGAVNDRIAYLQALPVEQYDQRMVQVMIAARDWLVIKFDL